MENEKLDLILAEMQGMRQEMAGMKQEIAGVKQDISGIKQEMAGMKQDISGIKQEMAGMKQEIADVKQKVKKIELTLENEIRVNIQRVAEGHLDLSRILHDAMRPNNEMEMLAIKVRTLEGEVKEIKEKLA